MSSLQVVNKCILKSSYCFQSQFWSSAVMHYMDILSGNNKNKGQNGNLDSLEAFLLVQYSHLTLQSEASASGWQHCSPSDS